MQSTIHSVDTSTSKTTGQMLEIKQTKSSWKYKDCKFFHDQFKPAVHKRKFPKNPEFELSLSMANTLCRAGWW